MNHVRGDGGPLVVDLDLDLLERPQLGRGRLIPLPGPTFHASVKVRSDDPKLKYKPRARYVKGTERYVT
jgi:hypothetical protein